MRPLLAVALLAVACNASPKAEVTCQARACAVKATGGADALEVCFDYLLHCKGDAPAVANVCQLVAPGHSATRLITDDDFTMMPDHCSPSGYETTNVTTRKAK